MVSRNNVKTKQKVTFLVIVFFEIMQSTLNLLDSKKLCRLFFSLPEKWKSNLIFSIYKFHKQKHCFLRDQFFKVWHQTWKKYSDLRFSNAPFPFPWIYFLHWRHQRLVNSIHTENCWRRFDPNLFEVEKKLFDILESLSNISKQQRCARPPKKFCKLLMGYSGRHIE